MTFSKNFLSHLRKDVSACIQSLSFLLLSQEPWHHFGTHLPKVSTKVVRTISLFIPTSLAMTRIVKRRSLQTKCQIFSMLVSVVEVQGLPDLGSSSTFSLPFTNCLCHLKTCSGRGRISINITQHLQNLSRRFSKFGTKFDVNSLLNHHSAIEFLIAKKLNQISHSNFLQVVNHIHLWLRKSKNSCNIVSKQLLNNEHMLHHTVKVLITHG